MRREKPRNGRQDELQRNKTEIGHDPVHRKRKRLPRQIAGIGIVHHDDAGIGRKRGIELAFPHIDTDNGLSPALQQTIGKAARAGPQIAKDAA